MQSQTTIFLFILKNSSKRPGQTHINLVVSLIEGLTFRDKTAYGKPSCLFSGLTDPRVERTREHYLDDILFITIASTIYGAEGWNDMEEFGKSKEEWLKNFLQLPNGIPSYNTFNRVFSALNPEEFLHGLA